ncbi:MAG: ATP-binding protein [bacterium]
MEKFVYSWSGGKDSALGLYEMQRAGARPEYLFTTVTRDYDRISMHGVRADLLREQAGALGVSLWVVTIPANCTNQVYEEIMAEQMQKLLAAGITRVAFSDIFLEDVRRYREDNLSRAGMEAVFPLWGRDTAMLAGRFRELGFQAAVTCVDGNALDGSFAGKEYDRHFLDSLPAGVDPCGENGEFHCFVYDGPLFSRPLRFRQGEVVKREGRFYFQELVPAGGASKQAAMGRSEACCTTFGGNKYMGG